MGKRVIRKDSLDYEEYKEQCEQAVAIVEDFTKHKITDEEKNEIIRGLIIQSYNYTGNEVISVTEYDDAIEIINAG